jgi:predicted RNA-binding protein with PUA-like domain
VRRGDEILFYHTGEEKKAVGLMKAATDARPDPSRKEERFVVVEVQPKRKLRRAVTLLEIKSDPSFAGFDLVRIPRLSVMPVAEKFWTAILKMSEN